MQVVLGHDRSALKHGQEFVPEEQIDFSPVDQLPATGGYALFGFPEVLAQGDGVDGNPLAPRAMFVSCTMADESELSLSFRFSAKTSFALSISGGVTETDSGKPAELPAAFGMSGCAVWLAYTEATAATWDVSSARIVGVQSGYVSDKKALKVIGWHSVRAMIWQEWQI